MPLADLNDAEKHVVFECLKCVATGTVIKHDWEFQTIFGIEVAQLVAVVEAWPNIDDSDEVASLAINNSMNNLLGYPHGCHADWDKHMPIPLREIARVFQKWRGEPVGNYVEGLK
jgi:hypothetical protein